MRPTVLLVDTNSSVSDIVRTLLQRNAYNVRVLGEPEDVMPMLSEQTVDVIVTDVVMPTLNGFELGKRLRDDPATADIPLIYLTALDSLEDEFEGYLSGGDAYLTKPFKADDLLKAIQRVLDGEQKKSVTSRFTGASRIMCVVPTPVTKALTRATQGTGLDLHFELDLAQAFRRIDREQFRVFVVDASGEPDVVNQVQEFLSHFDLSVPVVFLTTVEKDIPLDLEGGLFHVLRGRLDDTTFCSLLKKLVTEFGEH
ncbi:response regulator [Planctomycetota bacterium]|nr:response regulator [Planctomycetota bacterium]